MIRGLIISIYRGFILIINIGLYIRVQTLVFVGIFVVFVGIGVVFVVSCSYKLQTATFDSFQPLKNPAIFVFVFSHVLA